MDVIINNIQTYPFKDVKIGDVFSDDLGRFMMKVSCEVIIERELLENLKKGANGYE